ncbi:MAG: sulfatase-like hydrolase/transferase [Acidobacteriota bacterium]
MKKILPFVLLLSMLPISSKSRGNSGPGRAPNVVLIVADCIGYGDIGPHGVPDIRTPGIDRLAREGIRLTDAYAAAPICSPSRASLLAGRYSQRFGMELNVQNTKDSVGLPAAENTLARRLKNAGYATAAFGKWHLGYDPASRPKTHGFDEFLGILDWTVDNYSHKTFFGEPGLYESATPVEKQGYLPKMIADRAVQFIDQHKTQPFFIYLSYHTALPPYQRPGHPEDVRDQDTWRRGNRQDYAAMVECVDQGVVRTLEALDRNRLIDNTLVIYTHDHGGEALSRGEPFFHGIATLWEGGLRVPCLLRWPGHVPAGAISPQVSVNMDLTATILAAAGQLPPADKSLDGIDLLPILSGKSPVVDRSLFWRINFPRRTQKAVRSGKWKYVFDVHAHMLFDMETDPSERHNVAYQQPEVMARLRAALAQWEAELPAPPKINPPPPAGR